MNHSLLIIAATAFVAMVAIFGWRKAPGILLGISATLSAAWIVSTILTA
jgi:type IV secretory pathway VirB2 component (pilin)